MLNCDHGWLRRFVDSGEISMRRAAAKYAAAKSSDKSGMTPEMREDLARALISLGFKPGEAKRKAALCPKATIEEGVIWALA